MNLDQLEKYLLTQYETEFKGWDFSVLEGKMEETPVPWSYQNIIETYFKAASWMLDMGTGGGEFLDSLSNLPPRVFATEGYEPNVEIARDRLRGRGIEVRQLLHGTTLPFEDLLFDLIINRHEEYAVSELYRVLKPGAVFITQQVGGLNDIDINAALGAPPPVYFNWCLSTALGDLSDHGFIIVASHEYLGKTRFYDIGSIVYYLKCIPWQIPDFSVANYLKRLALLNEFIQQHGFIEFINHRFYVIAQKKIE